MSGCSMQGWIASLILVGAAGCIDLGGGGGAAVSIEVDLGTQRRFELGEGDQQANGRSINISNELPTDPPSRGTLRLRTTEIAMTATGSDLRPEVEVIFRFASSSVDDPCDSDVLVGPVFLDLSSGGEETISPTSLSLPRDALDLVLEGDFQLCVEATAIEGAADLDIGRFDLVLSSPSGGCDYISGQAPACADLLSDPQVAGAVTTLSANGFPFSLPTGGTPANILGTWDYTRVIDFDPSGSNTGQTSSGTISFTEQASGTILQTISGTALEYSIGGDGDAVGLCAFARSEGADCSQSLAGMISYQVGPEGDSLVGPFLSVVVCGDEQTSGGCAPLGDFAYGTLMLIRSGREFVRPTVSLIGKVTLPDTVTPDWLVIRPDGTGGVVTGNAGQLFSFTAQDPFTAVAVTLPFAGAFPFTGIGMAEDGSKYGVILDGAARLFVYNTADDTLLRQASSRGFNLTGGVFDFSPDTAFAYLVSPHSGDDDNVVALPATGGEDFTAGDDDRSQTPDDESPRTARLSPDGSQLAVLLAGGATGDQSNLLSFLDLTATPPRFGAVVDLGGSVRSDDIVYTEDGTRLFLAGTNGVIAVEAVDPFDVTVIDVARDSDDPTLTLALTGDGNVVVGTQAAEGEFDFAVVDGSSLAVLNRQRLDPIHGAVSGVAHFGNVQVALVTVETGPTILAVESTPPYSVLTTLSASDAGTNDLLGRIVGGGDLIGVVNIDEGAVYLYRAAP